jgi:hypothetical protein
VTELEALKLVWRMARRFHQGSVLHGLEKEPGINELMGAEKVAAVKAIQGKATDLVWRLIERADAAQKNQKKAWELINEAVAEVGAVIVDTIDLDQIREQLTELGYGEIAESLSNEEMASYVDTALDSAMSGDGYSDFITEAREAAVDLIAQAKT